MFKMFKALWQYRGFVVTSIFNELKIKFARSRLGIFWLILQPFTQVLIYAVILSNVLSAKLPGIQSKHAYVLYLMTGTIVWTLFSEIVTRFLSLFIDNANLIKKMQFPRVTLPTVVIGSALLNHIILLIATLFIFICLGHVPGFELFLLPILTLALVAVSVGVGLILGILNVFIRDLTHIVPILMQVIFWATPIVYPISIIPLHLQKLLIYNPLYPLLKVFQQLLLNQTLPQMHIVVEILMMAFALLGFAYFLFRRARAEMVDVL